MALVTKIEEIRKDRQKAHAQVRCCCSTFTDALGDRYLQLDTYGAADREFPDQPSQQIQLNADSAAQLKQLIEKTFG